MVKSSSGFRKGTRRKLRSKSKSKFTITPYIREFKEKERVVVSINPSSHRGMPHHRYQGKTGIIREKRGNSFIVDIKLGSKAKELIVRPEHLKPHGGG